MLDTLQRRQFRKRDGHAVMFKLILFSETSYYSPVYPAAPASVTVTSATAAN
ncbi:hypothetical protein AB2E22_22115 [Escherichia coli]